VKDYLLTHGVNPLDIPIAIGLFKVAAYGTWIVITAACIRYRPVNYFFQSGLPRALLVRTKTRFPKACERLENRVTHTADIVAEWKITQKLLGRLNKIKEDRSEAPETFKARARRNLGLGVAEGVLMYKITFPVWAPFYFFLILFYYSKRRMELGDSLEHVKTSLSHGDVITSDRIADFSWLKAILKPSNFVGDEIDADEIDLPLS